MDVLDSAIMFLILAVIGGIFGIGKYMYSLDDDIQTPLRKAFSAAIISASFAMSSPLILLMVDIKQEYEVLILIAFGSFLAFSGNDIIRKTLEKILQLKNDKTNIGSTKND